MKYFTEFKKPFFWSLYIVLFICICFIFQNIYPSLSQFGIRPREMNSLLHVLTFPLLHGDFMHLFNNMTTLLMLMIFAFYFYKKLALEAMIWMYIFSGFLLWIIGSPNTHIGASAFIYALAFFMVILGIGIGNKRSSALVMLIIFLYGSLIWGLYPLPAIARISWEGHLAGAISGIITALFFIKEAKPHVPEEKIEIEEPDDDDPYWLEGE